MFEFSEFSTDLISSHLARILHLNYNQNYRVPDLFSFKNYEQLQPFFFNLKVEQHAENKPDTLSNTLILKTDFAIFNYQAFRRYIQIAMKRCESKTVLEILKSFKYFNFIDFCPNVCAKKKY